MLFQLLSFPPRHSGQEESWLRNDSSGLFVSRETAHGSSKLQPMHALALNAVGTNNHKTCATAYRVGDRRRFHHATLLPCGKEQKTKREARTPSLRAPRRRNEEPPQRSAGQEKTEGRRRIGFAMIERLFRVRRRRSNRNGEQS